MKQDSEKVRDAGIMPRRRARKLTFALIGNQNCGKTTLFNQLTGSNQHVGNFPGVTVEKKEGEIRNRHGAVVVDLPGIYSLSPYTAEEIVTRDFVLNEKPDGIINIVDATNIERNLYLTLQLMELQVPMVVALNMMDEVTASGASIEVLKLSEKLGIPVLPISAVKNEGVDELCDRAIKTAEKKLAPARMDFCGGAVHKAIHSVSHLVEAHAIAMEIPPRFAATKLVEGDPIMSEKLGIRAADLDIIQHIVEDMENTLGTDREAALADMRYQFVEKLVAEVVHKPRETKEQQRSIKIDRVLTHKYFSLPIFLCIMGAVFFLTFNVVGKALSDLLSLGIDAFTAWIDGLLSTASVNPAIHSLIIDGIFTGVGSVLSFLPTIVTLFFFLSLLEDSGYMARVAFVMDKLLRKIGLSGKSFVPMLIGFGCSVPAIMATRTLSSERDRKMTILLIPFMSCSAKLPIYSIFTMAFFPKYQALVMIGIYVLGMVMAVLSGLALKNTVFRGKPVPFVMELPAYRLPGAKSIFLHMWEKARDFIKKAFTVIFLATIVIWFLQTFDFSLSMVDDSAHSMLASIGSAVAPIFAPLGFGDWRASTALLTGLTAKEAVVSTYAVLLGVEVSNLPAMLSTMMTPIAAFSFLSFTLLYMPCVAAMAAVRRELGSGVKALGYMAYQTGLAWVVAFLIYQLGTAILHLTVI